MSSPLTPETSATTSVPDGPDAGVPTESVTTDSGGEQLSDPAIVSDDAKNQTAPGGRMTDTPTRIGDPITIICGTAEQQIQFSAFPDDGTIAVQTFGEEGDFTEFALEEFALIAALLVNTADGDY